jgi:hypothetical protein
VPESIPRDLGRDVQWLAIFQRQDLELHMTQMVEKGTCNGNALAHSPGDSLDKHRESGDWGLTADTGDTPPDRLPKQHQGRQASCVLDTDSNN